jgi:acetoin utilization deacetylase AcuC-like enzyme
MRLFFTDQYVLPLPEGHRFPMAKYARLRERAAAELVPPHELVGPEPASDADLLRVHAAPYVERVVSGTLAREEIRRIGFPWSAAMVERSRRSAGATLGACRAALAGEGVAVNLAGGTHHAFADRGEGYCVFNDTAVAARAMQAEKRAERILVVDCDVHQGNGTASIFRGDPSVFTFSIHGAKNFPFRKEESDLDVELPDGTGDAEYAAALERGLAAALARFDPDLAVYVAGADPFEGDRLGRLRVSKSGLAARDRFVLETLRSRGIPVAVTMAGGYAKNVDDTVAIHFETVRIAAELSELAEPSTSPPPLLRLARSAPA